MFKTSIVNRTIFSVGVMFFLCAGIVSWARDFTYVGTVDLGSARASLFFVGVLTCGFALLLDRIAPDIPDGDK